ncbi:MAG: ABC transporter permease [Candidatus Bathyarchaeota archaeon]|nr:ABC transporter permease [Candidatus Bathyarchaeota archaeon]
MTDSAHFPTNDLKRRRLQTGLTVATLTLSVASTLFLLLFSNRLGVGIAAKATGTLTLGLTSIFSQFILFLGVLIFAVGAILTSFIISLMMAQRTRDFGLIKAAGCPNSLVAGYFMTELLTITLIGCTLGVAMGFVADFVVAFLVFGGYLLPMFWFAPIVFVAFFLLAIFFGLRPILKASRMSPMDALSPVSYYGSFTEKRHKPLSRRAITWHLASRSMGRRQSVGIRMVFLLSVVFILLTVTVGGSVIASDTTTAWIENTSGTDTVLVAYPSMGNQYLDLLSAFHGTQVNTDFNYLEPNLGIPSEGTAKIAALSGVTVVEPRLVVTEHLQEVSNFTIIDNVTYPVGDDREADSLVVGVNPQTLSGNWSLKGKFFDSPSDLEAVVGDSLTQSMFYAHPKRYVYMSDPLLEGLRFENHTFDIVGICVEPLNNGQVVYVPLETLQNITGTDANLLIVELDSAVDRVTSITGIRDALHAVDPELAVFDLKDVTQQNMNFLSTTWQSLMLLPIFSLSSAALCMVGYMMLVVNEQRQEFGTLRAVGAKPRIVLSISAIQSVIMLVASFAIGLSIGVVITLIFLMANPLVTATTIFVIGGWLAAALIAMYILSLLPAYQQTKTSILETLS